MSVSSLDITLLRFLKHKKNYDLYMRGVPKGGLDSTTATILEIYKLFFADNTDATVANPDDVWAWTRLKYPNMKEEAKTLIPTMLKNAVEDVTPEVQDGIAKRLAELRAALETQEVLEKYHEGGEVDMIATLRAIVDRQDTGSYDIPIVRDDINDLLKEEENDSGIKWRLACLNRTMRPLRSGDFGILAARVDVGKTTALVSELTFMAPQVEAYFGSKRPIIYLNNEGPGRRIKQRAYQAALGATIPELVEFSRDGSLQRRYIEAMGGWDSLLIVDVHDKPLSYLEDIIRRQNPSIVVTDMLDVVNMDGQVINGGSRTDQILEAAYQRGRIWGVLYDCIHIAASQLSAEADGELWPKLSQLANSRTGKAGAADFVLMMGSSGDEAHAGLRWMSLPKNKLARLGQKDPRETVQFLGDRARLIDGDNL